MSGRRAIMLVQIAILLGFIWMAHSTLGGVERPASAPVMPLATVEPEDFGVAEYSLIPLTEFSSTGTRPLFEPSRRPGSIEPSEPQGVVTEKQIPDVGAYVLSAVIIVDQQRIALLGNPGTGELLRGREGDRVEGWTIDEIRSDSVLFSYDGRQNEVMLRTFDAQRNSHARTTQSNGSADTGSGDIDALDCGLSRC